MANVKARSHQKLKEKGINSCLYSITLKKKVQHSSAIKKEKCLVYLELFLLISMVELDQSSGDFFKTAREAQLMVKYVLLC